MHNHQHIYLQSSPTGPAEHCAGGSRPRSCSSCNTNGQSKAISTKYMVKKTHTRTDKKYTPPPAWANGSLRCVEWGGLKIDKMPNIYNILMSVCISDVHYNKVPYTYFFCNSYFCPPSQNSMIPFLHASPGFCTPKHICVAFLLCLLNALRDNHHNATTTRMSTVCIWFFRRACRRPCFWPRPVVETTLRPVDQNVCFATELSIDAHKRHKITHTHATFVPTQHCVFHALGRTLHKSTAPKENKLTSAATLRAITADIRRHTLAHINTRARTRAHRACLYLWSFRRRLAAAPISLSLSRSFALRLSGLYAAEVIARSVRTRACEERMFLIATLACMHMCARILYIYLKVYLCALTAADWRRHLANFTHALYRKNCRHRRPELTRPMHINTHHSTLFMFVDA